MHRRLLAGGDHLPEFLAAVHTRPTLAERAAAIGAAMEPVPIPWDCQDGFFDSYWRRPEAYLQEPVRRGTSVWARVGPEAEQRTVGALGDDLASGLWHRATITSSASRRPSSGRGC